MSLALSKPKAVRRPKPPALEPIRAELARARVVARAWAATLSETRRSGQAVLFARATLEELAAVSAPNITLSALFSPVKGTLDTTALQLARSMGRLAAVLPTIEGCNALTSLYTTLLPSKERSALGAFYTPAALTQRLLDLAGEGGIDWKTARVLDPASGGGAFLLEAAARMADRQAQLRPCPAHDRKGTAAPAGYKLHPVGRCGSELAIRRSRPIPLRRLSASFCRLKSFRQRQVERSQAHEHRPAAPG